MRTKGSKSLLGIKGTDFEIRLEYSDEYVLVHLPYVARFTKGAFIEMSVLLEEWNDFFKTVGYDGIYAALDTNNTKIVRLATKLGFRPLGNSHGLVVYKYEV